MKFNLKYILGISFISALGGYLFGFDFAVITGGLPFLADQFGLDASGEGATTASLAIGAVVGCILAGRLSEQWGRKKGLLIAATTFTISSLIMGLAPNLSIFVTGRFFAGIGVGMASMLSPMYIAEIAPDKYRGRLVSLNQLTIVLGIVITHLVNFGLKDLGPEAWRWMFGAGAIPAGLFMIGVIFLPESPRWLIQKNRESEAQKILNKIGGAEFAATTISNVKTSTKNDSSTSVNLWQRIYLPVLFVGITLAVFQQWCGINVVFNYTAKIFESIGADRSEQLIQAVYIGIANLVFTIIAMTLVDKIGRKPLMLFGAGGLSVFYIIIAFILKTGNGAFLSPFILVAIGIYAISLAPITWVLISEIFPNNIRSKALSTATVALWLAYSILVFTFPIISEKMGEFFPFIMYAIICLLGFFFILFKLKETKGKSLEELEGDYRQ
ncbi:MAG: sugar porter family MFS transporter [Prolixibacteraceae bacterium]